MPGKKICKDQFENMFSNIHEKADWNISGNLLSGCFFTYSEKKLEAARDVLISNGYIFAHEFGLDSYDGVDVDSVAR